MLRAVGLPWCIGVALWQGMIAKSHMVSLTWHYAAAAALGVGLVMVLRSVVSVEAADQGRAGMVRALRLGVGAGMAAGLIWLALWCLPSGLLFAGLMMAVLAMIYLAAYVSSPGSVGQRVILFVLCGLASMALSAFALPFSIKLIAYVLMIGITLGCLSPAVTRALRFHFPEKVCASLIMALGCGAAVHFWVDGGHSWLCGEVMVVWGLFAVCLATLTMQRVPREAADAPRLAVCETRRSVLSWVVLLGLMLRIAGWMGHQSEGELVFNVAAGVSLVGLMLVHQARGRFSQGFLRWCVDLSVVLPPLGGLVCG